MRNWLGGFRAPDIRALGLTWDGGGRKSPAHIGLTWDSARPVLILLAILALLASTVALPAHADADANATDSYIVMTSPGANPAAAVEAAGGTVTTALSLVNGVEADLDAGAVASLRSNAAVTTVVRDAAVTLTGWETDDDDEVDLEEVAESLTGALDGWQSGFTGDGVDVAIIDSGVAPVPGLNAPGKLVHGADLSFESQAANLSHLDTYGHGTHLAGIIAGNMSGSASVTSAYDDTFVGIAPDARIVSVKVADAVGAVDVSQVIAGIDWVIQHRTDNGLNIRVLNLSFGTNGVQSYQLDPLAFAVEQAWKAGIVVVVAAGNDGNSAALRNPALNPFVIAVGSVSASGANNPWAVGSLKLVDEDEWDDDDWDDDEWEDDFWDDDEWDDDSLSDSARKEALLQGLFGMTVSTFSNCGTSSRHVDLVAPGESVISLRVPGSWADQNYPGARVGTQLFRGSGTSQAAAVVSGAAALLLEQRPNMSPDQVKKLLKNSALEAGSGNCWGAGVLNIRRALWMGTPNWATQTHSASTGLGTLEGARGSAHLIDGDDVLDGEMDIFGEAFDTSSWAPAAAAGNTWSSGEWNGNTWSGNTWSGNTWSTAVWTGNTWSGNTWSGNTWSGNTWSGNTWSGNTWSGNTWSGNTWSGNTWSGNTWSGPRVWMMRVVRVQ